jgi:hypothetical protein
MQAASACHAKRQNQFFNLLERPEARGLVSRLHYLQAITTVAARSVYS